MDKVSPHHTWDMDKSVPQGLPLTGHKTPHAHSHTNTHTYTHCVAGRIIFYFTHRHAHTDTHTTPSPPRHSADSHRKTDIRAASRTRESHLLVWLSIDSPCVSDTLHPQHRFARMERPTHTQMDNRKAHSHRQTDRQTDNHSRSTIPPKHVKARTHRPLFSSLCVAPLCASPGRVCRGNPMLPYRDSTRSPLQPLVKDAQGETLCRENSPSCASQKPPRAPIFAASMSPFIERHTRAVKWRTTRKRCGRHHMNTHTCTSAALSRNQNPNKEAHRRAGAIPC